ncbi:MAG: hypothetical protein RL367_765 [Pseudomonadota bacterium]
MRDSITGCIRMTILRNSTANRAKRVRRALGVTTSGIAVLVASWAGAALSDRFGIPKPPDFASYAATYVGLNFTTIWQPPNQAGQNGIAGAHYPVLRALP